ncbi:transposase [Ligilactobacillus salivarius]
MWTTKCWTLTDVPLRKDAFAYADATLFKVHHGHVVTSNSLLVAIGIDPSGRREVLGFDSRLIKKSGVVTV